MSPEETAQTLQLILQQIAGLTDALAKQEARHHEEMTAIRKELAAAIAKSAPATSPADASTSADKDLADAEPANNGTPSGDGSTPARITTPTTPTTKPRTDRLPDPPLFNGRRKDLPAFIRKLRYKLEGNADRYPDERSRLLYAHSRLEKDAVSLIDPLMDDDICDVDQLIAFLEATYGDPNRELTALSRLSKLKQGKRSFTSHFAEFRRLAADTGLNEIGLIASLRSSLSTELQRAMVGEKLPRDLNTYANLVATYDNNLRFLPEQTRSNKMVYMHPDAMEIDVGNYAPLGSKERQKRITEGRCFKCNEKGHISRNCSVPMPQIRASSTHSHLSFKQKQSLRTRRNRQVSLSSFSSEESRGRSRSRSRSRKGKASSRS